MAINRFLTIERLMEKAASYESRAVEIGPPNNGLHMTLALTLYDIASDIEAFDDEEEIERLYGRTGYVIPVI